MKKDKIKITHLQNPTQVFQLGELNILTDPVLTDGEYYYGNWCRYLRFRN